MADKMHGTASPRPDWMINTLSASGDGFFFSRIFDESSIPKLNESSNKYERLAIALIRLRRGDFSAGEQIVNVLLASNSAGAWIAGGYLLAHAIPHASLLALGRRIVDAAKQCIDGRTADHHRGVVCEAWSRAMMIAAVPEMIDIYRGTSWPDVRERILIEMSTMFEPALGDLYDTIDVGSETFDEEGYLNTLLEHHAKAVKLVAAAGTTLFYKGEPFDFSSWTINFLKRITAKGSRFAEDFSADRMFFEANSGRNCSDFFSPHGEFLPQTAAAIINRFLSSEVSQHFEPGVRYFFGHPLPDYAQ